MTALAIDIPYEAIRVFCEQHHIRKLMLFGSVLREDFGPDSDIDVLVEFEENTHPDLFDLGAVLMGLRELLARDIDLGTPNMLSPYIKDRVMMQAAVIYERS